MGLFDGIFSGITNKVRATDEKRINDEISQLRDQILTDIGELNKKAMKLEELKQKLVTPPPPSPAKSELTSENVDNTVPVAPEEGAEGAELDDGAEVAGKEAPETKESESPKSPGIFEKFFKPAEASATVPAPTEVTAPAAPAATSVNVAQPPPPPPPPSQAPPPPPPQQVQQRPLETIDNSVNKGIPPIANNNYNNDLRSEPVGANYDMYDGGKKTKRKTKSKRRTRRNKKIVSHVTTENTPALADNEE
jgi:hypothetical protein